jgi:hypothetical protein
VVAVALHTAIYGPYDKVKPVPPTLGVPAFFHTDLLSTAMHAAELGWTPKIVPHSVATLKGDPDVTAPMLSHKWWKTHPDLAAPEAEVSLWVDGSMTVHDGYVEKCMEALGDDDWVLVKHPWRDCALAEALYSAELIWRYDRVTLMAQHDSYARFHPAGWGLFATGASVRRHTPAVLELGRQWWTECLTWSHQDQVSLPVLLKLAGDQIRWNTKMPWEEWWTLTPHGS